MLAALFLAAVVLALAVAAKAAREGGLRKMEGNTQAASPGSQTLERVQESPAGRWHLAPRSRVNTSAGSGELCRVDRQLPDPLAGQLEQRVGERRDDRWQRRLAHAGRGVVGLHELDFDARRRRHARQLVFVEVADLGAAVLDLDR